MRPGSTEPTSTRGAAPAEPAHCGDEVWARLVTATARVVARKGYADTRIVDIAREAGESTAAIFGRFRSKNDLLRQALVHLSTAATICSMRHLIDPGMAGREGSAMPTGAARSADASS